MIGGEYMEDLRIFLVFGSFVAGGAFITWLSSILLKKRIWKFIPSLASFVVVVISAILMYMNKGEGMRDLANFAMVLVFGCFFIGALITAIIIDRKKKR